MIKFLRNHTSGQIPTAGDLEVGEIAINTVDGIIYTKNMSGSIVVLADNTANNSNVEATVYIDDTPPITSVSGKLWWDTGSGRMMIYYSDIDSGQWIEASPSAAGPMVPTVSATPTHLDINQLNTVVPNPAAGDEVFLINISKKILYNGTYWVESADPTTIIQ